MRQKMKIENTEDKMSLKAGYDRFIIVRKAMEVSEHTIKDYNATYKHFSEFYGEYNLCKDLKEDTVFEFIQYLKQKNEKMTSVTINFYLRHMRAVFNFFIEKGYTKHFKVKLVKQEKKIKEVYTEDELTRLLKKPKIRTDNFPEYRNWVMINYFIGTGNRLSTVCELKIKDIDFEDHEIYLRKVKNKKQYIIPLSKSLEKILREYIQHRKGDKEDYLFCNQFGDKQHPDSVKNAIRKYNHRRGVTKTSIHLFRHTFAKNWILNGGDIFRLQKLLGHNSIDIVKEYVNMFSDDLKNDFEEFNLLDTISEKSKPKQALRL